MENGLLLVFAEEELNHLGTVQAHVPVARHQHRKAHTLWILRLAFVSKEWLDPVRYQVRRMINVIKTCAFWKLSSYEVLS